MGWRFEGEGEGLMRHELMIYGYAYANSAYRAAEPVVAYKRRRSDGTALSLICSKIKRTSLLES
jgi:hypothetical protein